MLIRNVPFIGDKKEEYGACQGPPTTMMALRFFRPKVKISFPELYKKMGYEKGKWFFESYVVELLSSYGIPCIYYSDEDVKPIGNDKQRFNSVTGLEFNKRNEQNVDTKHYDSSLSYALKNGLFKKQRIDLDFIIENIKNRKLIIAIVNRNELSGGDGFRGHFTLIRGFEKDNLICNDSYFGENVWIEFKDFKNAFYAIDWGDRQKRKTHHIIVLG